MDLSNNGYFISSPAKMTTRKRHSFFIGNGEGSEQLPVLMTSSNSNSSTASAPLMASPPSSGNLRLAPGRSLSSSAALLRQRGSATGSPTSPNKLRTYSGDLDGLIHAQSSPYYNYPYTQQTQVQPQSYQSSSPSKWNFLFQAVFLIGFVCLCIFGMATHESNFELQHTLKMRDAEIEHHLHHSEELEKKVQRLRSETLALNRQIESLEEMPAAGFTELQRKLFHLEHSQNLVQQGIQANDRRAVRER